MDYSKVNLVDGLAIGPEIALWFFACLAFVIEWLRPRTGKGSGRSQQFLSAEFCALLGLVIALALVMVQAMARPHLAFSGTVAMDPLAWFFKALCILTPLLLMPSSWQYMQGKAHRPEFYGLLLLATSGMTLMVQSTDLILLFLAIEFLSITSYILVGYVKGNRRSSEAAVKYFLFGSVCSALMLYGMSLLYGVTGSTHFAEINQHLGTASALLVQPLYILIVVTFLAGIGFKISMWPFHMWAPDAYEGAPTPVTAFLSVGPKLAGIAVFLRVAESMFINEPHWPVILGIISIITMTWGNLAALAQTNVKRLLAYSSIAQAGYLLVGVVALSAAPSLGGGGGDIGALPAHLSYILDYAKPAVLIYSLAYLIMNLGAFIITIEVERMSGGSDIEGFAGLGERSPLLAACMTVFLLGLGGIPLTAGFIGKLFLFGSAVAGGFSTHSTILWGLAAFGVVNSVISIYYYFKVVRPMWLQPRTDRVGTPIKAISILALFLATLTIVLGIFGDGLISPSTKYQAIYFQPVALSNSVVPPAAMAAPGRTMMAGDRVVMTAPVTP